MLFHSSLRKELSRSFGATLVVLITVVMTMTLIRTLGQASRGTFDPSDVTLVMGYTVLAYTPTLLSMSLFISVIAVLSRMYRESEMVIWFCSGRGLSSLLNPLMRFSWPIFGVIAALALLVLPWTNQRIDDLKAQYERRGDLERIEPGQFQESANGAKVFFVEKNAKNALSGSNIFIATTEFGKETITSAASGRIESQSHGKFLLLRNGQRLETDVQSKDLKVSEFEEYGTQVTSDPMAGTEGAFINTYTTLALIKQATPTAFGELSWRLGLLLAAINFVIIGIASSSVNPRMGKSINLISSLFTFVIYFNLLSLGQNWIASGKASFAGFMMALHGGIFFLSISWLAKGHNNWHLRAIFDFKPGTSGKQGGEI